MPDETDAGVVLFFSAKLCMSNNVSEAGAVVFWEAKLCVITDPDFAPWAWI